MSDTGITPHTQFPDENLTEYTHLDPDKHWIGEALPSPSLAEVKFAGLQTTPGVSPFPARADHRHDVKTVFTALGNGTGVTIGPGTAAFINGLTPFVFFEDWRHSGSTQLIDFPQEGAYRVGLYYRIERSSGTFPAGANGAHELRFYYQNASIGFQVKHVPHVAGHTIHIDQAFDEVFYDSVDPTSNLQLWFHNFDTVNVLVKINKFVVKRESSRSVGS